MILRLRHAVPWLQKLGGWSVCTFPPPLARRFAGSGWTSMAFAPSAPGDSVDSQPDPDSSNSLPSSSAVDSGPEKRKRHSARGGKASAEAEPQDNAAAAAASEDALREGPASAAAASTSQVAPTKRRTSSTRKAAASSRTTSASSSSGIGDADAVEQEGGCVAPVTRSTRRKKQEALDEAGPEAAAASQLGSAVQAQPISGEEAASRTAETAGTSSSKKRTSKGTSRKAAAAEASKGGAEAAKDDEQASIQSLPYEDFLVLPRKAEYILIALGLRSSSHDPAGSTAGASGSASPSGVGRGGSISNILELASYLGRPDPKELVAPLLLAQYQGYLGNSPDYLYDLFYMDFDPPFLSSQAVKNMVLEACMAARASSPLSAKGNPPEALARAAMDKLRAGLGDDRIAEQEARAARLTEAQVELFLLDWASARLAGSVGRGGIHYLARRCAALQLTRPIVVERLYRYAVRGQSLAELASTGARTVKLSQPMDALVEGLKAGVRMDPERLLHDFRLTSLGAPLRDHLEELRQAVILEAGRSLEPGSSMYYSTLVEKLHVHPEIKKALKHQESQWQNEQAERDGSLLTHAQVRLLFHLWRMERFRAEEQARRAAKAEKAATPEEP